MTRPLFSDRPLGFDPRWIVRHAALCCRPAQRLAVPRYIGGWLPAAHEGVQSHRPALAVRPDHWRDQCLAIELRDDERLALPVDGLLHVVASESDLKGCWT